MRRIVKPGTPRWVRAWSVPVPATADGTPALPEIGRDQQKAALAIVGTMVGGLLLTLLGMQVDGVFVPIGAAFILGTPLAVGAGIVVATRRLTSVSPTEPALGGVPITGRALELLEDIDARFAYAERLLTELPTGIDWPDVADSVEGLLWEAAEEAAKASALDAELVDLRYADRGTAQDVYRRELEARREEHLRLLEGIQRDADGLARDAANATAAAKVALARTGSLLALDVAAPTPHGLVAREALDAARARLELLAGVWAEVSEAEGDVRAAQATLERGRAPRRRSRRRE